MYLQDSLSIDKRTDLLRTLERQGQILNELARICVQIEQALKGKLAESEKAQKGETQ